MKAVRHPEFRCAGAPLSRRPSAWQAWGDVFKAAAYAAFTLGAVLWLAWYSGSTWSQDMGPTCYAWGGSGSSAQGQFIKCPPVIVQVPGPVQVREVKVPTPVIVPAPAPAPAVAPPPPKIRN